jgi:cyclase
MLRPRIIPCLLIQECGLVKTQQFKSPRYIGDPINAVRIFNEKEADELMVLDIDATVLGREPNFMLIDRLAAECRMPLCYGGGISRVDQAVRLINMGVEKIAISSAALGNPLLISELASAIGRQSVVVVVDVVKTSQGFGHGYTVCTHNANRVSNKCLFEFVKESVRLGAGEVVVNSVDNDGKMTGYDLKLAIQVRAEVGVPLTFLGGAGSLEDMANLIRNVGVVGCAAGSLFVFKGKLRGVLINYPTPVRKLELCQNVAK